MADVMSYCKMYTAIKVENHTYLVRDSGTWLAEKRKSGCYCS